MCRKKVLTGANPGMHSLSMSKTLNWDFAH